MHPLRELWDHNFYLFDLDGLVITEVGLWLMMMDALLVVPLIMAAFFYPGPVLLVTGAVLLATFGGYEGYVVWRRRHSRA